MTDNSTEETIEGQTSQESVIDNNTSEQSEGCAQENLEPQGEPLGAIEQPKQNNVVLNKLLEPETPPTPPKDKHTLRCEHIAKEYAKSYPNVTEFHITNNYQVFLDRDIQEAQHHQNSLGEGELITIKVK